MTAPVFDPGIAPSFSPSTDWNWPVLQFDPVKPYEQVIPLGLRPVREYSVGFKALTVQQRNYILSFFHSIGGPAGAFSWVTPDLIWAPEFSALVLTQVSGGALAQRTYQVRYTWYDDSTSGETTACAASSITVAANYLLKVTVPPPPTGAPGWRVYAHETLGSECLQASVLDTTIWTEPVGGLVTGTGLPPTENTLQPPLLWRLVGGLQEQKIRANRWAMSFTIREVWV
jgi:hypothetical protein